MLIRTFKTSYTFNHVALWIVGIILWIPGFRDASAPGSDQLTPLSESVISLFATIPWLAALVGFIVLLFESYFLNYTLANNNLIPRNSIFTAFIYMLLMSSGKGMLFFHPGLIANIFIIAALNNLLKIYTLEGAYTMVFNSALLISLASLFFPPAAWLIIFIWLTYIVYRIVQWREWFISVAGFSVPYIFMFMWYFWIDKTAIFRNSIHAFFDISSDVQMPAGITRIMIGSILILIFLRSLTGLINRVNEQKINIRKKIWCLIWLMFTSILTLVFAGNDPPLYIAGILMLPLCGITAVFALQNRKIFWFEMLINILAISIFIENYFF